MLAPTLSTKKGNRNSLIESGKWINVEGALVHKHLLGTLVMRKGLATVGRRPTKRRVWGQNVSEFLAVTPQRYCESFR
jgi:hypothetical protein